MDRKVLTNTAASTYIEASGWFVLSLWLSLLLSASVIDLLIDRVITSPHDQRRPTTDSDDNDDNHNDKTNHPEASI